jgi:hypothetical protein
VEPLSIQAFGALVKTKKGNRVRHLIWLTTTWCIWKIRNQYVFNGAAPSVSQLVDEIKYFSWSWLGVVPIPTVRLSFLFMSGA